MTANYVYGNDGRPYKLPAAAEGHVARRIPREMPDDFLLPPGEEPEEPIDTAAGKPVIVGGIFLAVVLGAIAYAALAGAYLWLKEVLS